MSSCTVAALAADSSLRLRVLVDVGNHDRLLRGVHVSDLDHPAQYAFPGELLLTNGLWLTTTDPRDWVQEARAAGVVAIGYGVGEMGSGHAGGRGRGVPGRRAARWSRCPPTWRSARSASA